MSRTPFGVILATPAFDRAHTGLLLAVSAASLGRPTLVFATQGGLHALCRDFSGLAGAGDLDPVFRARGVACFAELQEALRPMGVRLMACVAGMQAIALDASLLLDGVEQVGAPSFLEAVGEGQMVSP